MASVILLVGDNTPRVANFPQFSEAVRTVGLLWLLLDESAPKRNS
jgi:hypothetical protein